MKMMIKLQSNLVTMDDEATVTFNVINESNGIATLLSLEITNSNTAIFINNLGMKEGSSNTRLFSIVNSNDSNSVNSILTITANGEIHIGGIINGAIDSLSD